eukprot:jgi/Mesvir1/2411/Mv22149-RA.2
MEEGSVACWDLRERAQIHTSVTLAGDSGGSSKPTSGRTATGGAAKGVGEVTIVGRWPTYSTDPIPEDNHDGPVCQVRVTAASRGGGASGGAGGSQVAHGEAGGAGGLMDALATGSGRAGLQLLSLDTFGLLSVWMVNEMSSVDVAGADADFGLRVGGRVRLLHLAALRVGMRGGADSARLGGDPGVVATSATSDLSLFPHDPNRLVVTLDQGCCGHAARIGRPPPPLTFELGEGRIPCATCVEFSPFLKGYLLAGFEDGTLALFHESSSLPVATWSHFVGAGKAGAAVPAGAPSSTSLRAVRWSPGKPSVFFVLDANSCVYAFGLLEPKRHEPVLAESFGSGGDGGTVVSAMAASGPKKASAGAASASGVGSAPTPLKKKGLGTLGGDMGAAMITGGDPLAAVQHTLVLAFSDGRVDVHLLPRKLAVCPDMELEINAILTSLGAN